MRTCWPLGAKLLQRRGSLLKHWVFLSKRLAAQNEFAAIQRSLLRIRVTFQGAVCTNRVLRRKVFKLVPRKEPVTILSRYFINLDLLPAFFLASCCLVKSFFWGISSDHQDIYGHPSPKSMNSTNGSLLEWGCFVGTRLLHSRKIGCDYLGH